MKIKKGIHGTGLGLSHFLVSVSLDGTYVVLYGLLCKFASKAGAATDYLYFRTNGV